MDGLTGSGRADWAAPPIAWIISGCQWAWAFCEHPFAMLKQQFGWRRVRYRGMQRNAFDFTLLLTACNIKRSLSRSLRAEDAPLSHSMRSSPDG